MEKTALERMIEERNVYLKELEGKFDNAYEAKDYNSMMVTLAGQIRMLTEQVANLHQENQILKNYIVSMHPTYSEEERRVAMEQVLMQQETEQKHQQIRAAFK